MTNLLRTNCYQCFACGHRIITIDKDVGVTPFMVACEKEGCKDNMRSNFYSIPPDAVPTHEWYKPDENEFNGLNEWNKDHVRNGGLLLRKVRVQ